MTNCGCSDVTSTAVVLTDNSFETIRTLTYIVRCLRILGRLTVPKVCILTHAEWWTTASGELL